MKASILMKILLLVLLLQLAGCELANVMRMRAANDNVAPVWTTKTSSSELPTAYEGEKPYIYASINGIDGFRMLIDTGASFSMLMDTDRVTALNLPRGYELPISGWGDGNDSQAYQTTAGQFRVGPLIISDFKFAYLPLGQTEYFADPGEAIFDGVIGHDLLKHFIWTFDKKNNQIWLSSKSPISSSAAVRLPISTFMSKISVPATLDFGKNQRYEHDVIIDTGSRHFVKLSSAFIDNHAIELPKVQVSAADFGLSGEALHKRFNLHQLDLADLKLKFVKTNLIRADDEDDFWVIGGALMGQFITTVDYLNKQLILDPYPNHTFASRYNLLGLELRKKTNGNFIVRYVMPGFPAHQLHIASGDEVITIEGINTQLWSTEDWLVLTNTPGEYNLCFREAGCKQLVSKGLPGYSTP